MPPPATTSAQASATAFGRDQDRQEGVRVMSPLTRAQTYCTLARSGEGLMTRRQMAWLGMAAMGAFTALGACGGDDSTTTGGDAGGYDATPGGDGGADAGGGDAGMDASA